MVVEPIQTTEGDFVRLRRKENKRASDLIDNQGLTPESANALLRTRNLDRGILGWLLNVISGNKKNNIPQR